MSVKAFRGSFYALSVGLLGYLSLQLFFHSAVPEPSVDYAEVLNAAVTSAPVEQQAWPHYRELWSKYGLAESGGESFEEIYVENDDSTNSKRLVRPLDENWSKAVAKLESIEELLDAWREYSALPHLGTPLHLDRRKYSDADLKALFPHRKRDELGEKGYNERDINPNPKYMRDAYHLLMGSVVNIQLPHIQQFREAARLLHVDTRLAVTQGDQKRAVANIKAIHGLAGQAADAPMLVCVLVGYAVNGIAFGVTEEVIIDNPDFFDEDHLLELQQLTASLRFSHLSKHLLFEQATVKDTIQRIYSDDGNGDGRVTAAGAEVKHEMILWLSQKKRGEFRWYAPVIRTATNPISLFSAPSRKEMESMFEDSLEEWSERLQRPMWGTEDTDWEDYLKQQDDSGLLQAFLGGMGDIKNAREVQLAYRDAVLLALACHRYRKANQEWPTSLDQLVGKWLKDTPIDRVNGQPLNFRIKEDALVIYSLGHDGDDDGGVNTDSDTPWLDKTGDGDWIVWPQASLNTN